METDEHTEYEELLIRYLQDTADAQALKRLYEIIRNSEEKRQELARLKTIYDSLLIQADARKFPVNISWEKMLQKMDNQKQPQISRVKHLSPLWSYAAIFLLVLSLGIQYLYYRSDKQMPEIHDAYTRFVVEKGGGKSSLFLPDGTKVLLNAGTTIQYPTQFNQKERTVMLDGEGYFEVAKDEQKPFIVKLKGYDVKVLGTVFNVKSYSDMDYSTTSLVSGKILLTSYDAEGTIEEQKVLNPDETVRIDRQTGSIKTFRSENDFLLAWTKGLYKFKDKPFSEIASELERLYDVTIVIEDEVLNQAVYTGSFVLEKTIDEVLKPLGKYNKFRFTKKGRVIHIYSKE